MVAIYDQIILFGDSITQQSGDQERGFAFAPALQADYIRRLDVMNRGFSGYNTDQALRVLPKIIPRPDSARVRFMTVFFGANDACGPEANNGQHVPLDAFKQNLGTILTHPVVGAHEPRLILLTPPPVDEHQLEIADLGKGYSQVTRTAKRTKSYADAAREVGQKLDIAVLDVWSLFMAKAGWKEGEPLPGSKSVERNAELGKLLYDGLHVNPAGYQIIHNEILKLIRRKWPDQAPEKLPFVLPEWDSVARWKNSQL